MDINDIRNERYIYFMYEITEKGVYLYIKKINDKYDDFDADDFFTQTCIRFSIGKITVFCYW